MSLNVRTQARITLTDAEKDAAILLDSDDTMLGTLRVANALANNLGYGTLAGQWVAAGRCLKDPDNVRWLPTLNTYPVYALDSETPIPPQPDEA
ncbi:MAG: hypothetical protein K2X25_08235 [Caulobacteraceae bacterium]|nr:hypothetical protein [Caulobacteraceae bacterium]